MYYIGHIKCLQDDRFFDLYRQVKYEYLNADTDDAGSFAISEQICCQSIVTSQVVCLLDG